MYKSQEVTIVTIYILLIMVYGMSLTKYSILASLQKSCYIHDCRIKGTYGFKAEIRDTFCSWTFFMTSSDLALSQANKCLL